MHARWPRVPMLTILLLTASLLSGFGHGMPAARADGPFDQIPPDSSDLWLSIQPGSPGDLCLSIASKPVDLPGAATVDDSDIMKFIPKSYGRNHTDGTFELWFDASEAGLTTDGEDIDAFDLIDDTMYFSTTGNFSVEGFEHGGDPGDKRITATGRDEDLVSCVYSDLPKCEYLRVVDMTALGFTEPGEDIDGLAINGNYFSTYGDYSVPGASGTNHDVIRRIESTSNFKKVFNAADHGITSNVNGLEVPLPPGTE